MSRTLSDDFEEDGSPGAGLELEKGSQTGQGGMPSGSTGYDSGGIDFDDDDGPARGALELDLPQGSAIAMRSGAPVAPGPPLPPAGGRSAPPSSSSVPDLAFGPPPSSRTSGAHAVAAPPPSSSQSSVPSVAPSSQRSLGTSGGESGGHPQAPASSQAAPSSASPANPPAPPARPTAAAVIAKYPPAPSEVWRAPKYAIQILYRQLEMRSELESLRRRRSPDVPLYEAALKAYDAKTFRAGMVINAAILTVATFIFFLPVMLRIIRAD